MAYPVSVGDVVECSIVASMNSQRILQVRHYIVSVSSGSTDFRDAVPLLQTNADGIDGWIAAWKEAVATTVVDIRSRWQIIAPVRKPPIYGPDMSTKTGNVTGQPMPQNIAAFIELTTDTAGRKGHGGIHVPGQIYDDGSNGQWGQDTLDRLDALGSRLKNEVTGGGITMYPVVYSRQNPTTSPKIVDWVSMNTVRTMRRRTVSVGE